MNTDTTISIKTDKRGRLSFLFENMILNEMVEMLFDITFNDNPELDDGICVRAFVYKGVCSNPIARWNKTRPHGTFEFSVRWGIDLPSIRSMRDKLLEVTSQHVTTKIPTGDYSEIDEFFRCLFEDRRKIILGSGIGRILNFSSSEEITEAISHAVVEQVIES